MATNKKRLASDMDTEVENANKKQKLASVDNTEPSLTDLPTDPLLHLLNFVGARGLLLLASTCSKWKTLVDSRLQSYVKKIFPVGFDHLLEPAKRAEAVREIKRSAKIEEVFGYRVKVMALEMGLDEPEAANPWMLRTIRISSPLQLLAWDEHILARLSPNSKACSIICSQTGRTLCTLNFDFLVTHFASSGLSQIAFAGTTPGVGDKVLVYAFDKQYTPSLIGTFARTDPHGGALHSVAWTSTNDLVLVRSTSYELCTVTGESLRNKSFEVNEEGAVHMVVSPDGSFAIRAQYEFSGEPAIFYKLDIAAGTEKRIFTLESVADFMDHLRFVGNNPDLLTWYIEGTGESAIFLRNLKTNKQQAWGVNTGINDISLDGTKVVAQIYDGEEAGRSHILDVGTKKQLGDILQQEEEDAEAPRFFAMQYYNWTYPNVTCGPSEKLLTSGGDHVTVFDPHTGKHLAKLQFFDDELFLRLVAVSRDNRTLVFGGDIVTGQTDAATAIVWHFY